MEHDLKEKLNALFAAYHEKLPQKLESINQNWQSLITNWDAADFQQFIREVHSFSGSSATYGYKKLSEKARGLEEFLKPFSQQSIPSAAEMKQGTGLLAELLQAPLTSENEAIFQQIEKSASLLRADKFKLFDRDILLRQLGSEVVTAQQAQASLNFILFELDYFASVREAYGDTASQQVIQTFLALLKTHLPLARMMSRYNENQFAIILPNTTYEQSIALCQTIRSDFSRLTFHAESSPFKVTVSVGIAQYQQGLDAKQLIETAINALQMAKK